MKPCPHCGCPAHKLAFSIEPATVAVACYRCEFTGPQVPMTFPPGRRSLDLAAEAWNLGMPATVAQRPARLAIPAL